METIFGTRERLNIPPRYNIAPTQDVVTIFRDPDFHDGEVGGGRHMGMMRWGYIAPWAKDLSGPQPINARIETIAEKPLFRGNLRHRRCLVPADSFFEWKGMAGHKQPHLIRPKNHDLMAFAGVWSEWNPPGETPTRTLAIVTTNSDGAIRELHDRMPVILEPEFYAAWLGEEEVTKAQILNPPHLSGEQLEFFPVSRLVSNVANDGPECLEPIELQAEAKPHRPKPAPPKQGSLF
jgi:putative SOS response-associated peptidase YedK